jgi:hypothetical protein
MALGYLGLPLSLALPRQGDPVVAPAKAMAKA